MRANVQIQIAPWLAGFVRWGPLVSGTRRGCHCPFSRRSRITPSWRSWARGRRSPRRRRSRVEWIGPWCPPMCCWIPALRFFRVGATLLILLVSRHEPYERSSGIAPSSAVPLPLVFNPFGPPRVLRSISLSPKSPERLWRRSAPSDSVVANRQ